MTLLDKTLSYLGLMRVAEHERFVETAGKALANSEDDLKRAEDTARRMTNDRNRIAAEHGVLDNERAAVQRALDKANDDLDDMTTKFKKAVTDLAAQADEIAGLKAAFDLTPWAHSVGDPPDYESPLGCVYDSGISYAFARLAEWLNVTDYEMGDGSEDYATDVGRTGANVLVAAGFVNEDGDLLTREDMAALKADALAMRKKRKADADRIQAKRDAAKGAGK